MKKEIEQCKTETLTMPMGTITTIPIGSNYLILLIVKKLNRKTPRKILFKTLLELRQFVIKTNITNLNLQINVSGNLKDDDFYKMILYVFSLVKIKITVFLFSKSTNKKINIKFNDFNLPHPEEQQFIDERDKHIYKIINPSEVNVEIVNKNKNLFIDEVSEYTKPENICKFMLKILNVQIYTREKLQCFQRNNLYIVSNYEPPKQLNYENLLCTLQKRMIYNIDIGGLNPLQRKHLQQRVLGGAIASYKYISGFFKNKPFSIFGYVPIRKYTSDENKDLQNFVSQMYIPRDIIIYLKKVDVCKYHNDCLIWSFLDWSQQETTSCSEFLSMDCFYLMLGNCLDGKYLDSDNFYCPVCAQCEKCKKMNSKCIKHLICKHESNVTTTEKIKSYFLN